MLLLDRPLKAELLAGGGLCYIGSLSHRCVPAPDAATELEATTSQQKSKKSRKKLKEMREENQNAAPETAAADVFVGLPAAAAVPEKPKRRYSIFNKGRRGSKAVQSQAAAALAAAAAEAQVADEGRPSVARSPAKTPHPTRCCTEYGLGTA